MKIGDQVQNLGLRIIFIQVFAFIVLGALGARLYYLQIVRGEYYSDRAETALERGI